MRTKNRFLPPNVGLHHLFLCKSQRLWIVWSKKSIFGPQHESDILTLLGAKQPCQVASFHLSLSVSKPDSFWKNRFFRFFIDVEHFPKGAKIGDRRQTMLLRAAKKIWKRGSIISRLSDLVEEHLSYLWIYFGRLEDVWNFRNWIFPKKSSENGSLHKHPPPCLVDATIFTLFTLLALLLDLLHAFIK